MTEDKYSEIHQNGGRTMHFRSRLQYEGVIQFAAMPGDNKNVTVLAETSIK